ncbi:hypothetical protein [Burkholderia cenocepacia]|uniref:hypothetical protein n=1 Tax=Burkholderia cenocepacia TaxID=95486 RepID=UPI0012B569CC|nr:hypothetical protein [Burkholderia cenocepacia]
MEGRSKKRAFKFFSIAFAALLLLALALLAIVVYVKNWDGGDGICPSMDQSQISTYMQKYFDHNNMSGVEVDDNFKYSSDLHQWIIRYRFHENRYEAKMTCFGYIVENKTVYN